LGVHEQSEGFTRLQEWDFEQTEPDEYPLLLNMPYFDLYRKQVLKQADLVLAMHWRGDAFTAEEKARNFAYYDERTVRDSSLSAATQAVLAAEVGHLDLAYDYLGEAALMDLHDINRNTRDGVHMASLAGAWLALVAGFGGMRDHNGTLSFAPRLPNQISRLDFALLWHGLRLRVRVVRDEVTYELRAADHVGNGYVDIVHHGRPVRVTADAPVTQSIPPAPDPGPPPAQPFGREPRRRSQPPRPRP
jgi:alpha,alpha-trehalose phosphorylase